MIKDATGPPLEKWHYPWRDVKMPVNANFRDFVKTNPRACTFGAGKRPRAIEFSGTDHIVFFVLSNVL